jgi:hypothetical protein
MNALDVTVERRRDGNIAPLKKKKAKEARTSGTFAT